MNEKKRTLFREDISQSCDYCQHSSPNSCLFNYTLSTQSTCFFFLYAPLKRVPKKKRKLHTFSVEDFSL